MADFGHIVKGIHIVLHLHQKPIRRDNAEEKLGLPSRQCNQAGIGFEDNFRSVFLGSWMMIADRTRAFETQNLLVVFVGLPVSIECNGFGLRKAVRLVIVVNFYKKY